jgi:hypothetical protein
MPISLSGHSVKCDSSVGEVIAMDSTAAIQKNNSKYLEKMRLINLVCPVCKQ